MYCNKNPQKIIIFGAIPEFFTNVQSEKGYGFSLSNSLATVTLLQCYIKTAKLSGAVILHTEYHLYHLLVQAMHHFITVGKNCSTLLTSLQNWPTRFQHNCEFFTPKKFPKCTLKISSHSHFTEVHIKLKKTVRRSYTTCKISSLELISASYAPFHTVGEIAPPYSRVFKIVPPHSHIIVIVSKPSS